eukprot:6212528-Pleurochrysis_carterae.AAC.2
MKRSVSFAYYDRCTKAGVACQLQAKGRRAGLVLPCSSHFHVSAIKRTMKRITAAQLASRTSRTTGITMTNCTQSLCNLKGLRCKIQRWYHHVPIGVSVALPCNVIETLWFSSCMEKPSAMSENFSIQQTTACPDNGPVAF